VVVLSHGYWTRRFGADPGVVGQRVGINGHPMTVVGVAPGGFSGVDVGVAIDVFVPVAMQAQVFPTWTRGLGDWRARWLTAMVRLRDGVSIEQARARRRRPPRRLRPRPVRRGPALRSHRARPGHVLAGHRRAARLRLPGRIHPRLEGGTARPHGGAALPVRPRPGRRTTSCACR
jgi:hypothetical protein